METIYQGIAYHIEVKSDEALAATGVVIAVRNPATGTYKAFLAEQITAGTLACTISADDTAKLPVGSYNLEIYTNLHGDMLYFRENYCRVIPSSATTTEEFIRVSYIVVNGHEYYRDATYDISAQVKDEYNLSCSYAWRTEDDLSDVEQKTVYSSISDVSVGMGVVYYRQEDVQDPNGKEGDTIFVLREYSAGLITKYVKANSVSTINVARTSGGSVQPVTLSNYYTKEEVDAKIASQGQEVDLSGIEAQLDDKANKVHTHDYSEITNTPTIPDTSEFALKTDIPSGIFNFCTEAQAASLAKTSHILYATQAPYAVFDEDNNTYYLVCDLKTGLTRHSSIDEISLDDLENGDYAVTLLQPIEYLTGYARLYVSDKYYFMTLTMLEDLPRKQEGKQYICPAGIYYYYKHKEDKLGFKKIGYTPFNI